MGQMWNCSEVGARNLISEHISFKPKCSIPHPSSLTPPCSSCKLLTSNLVHLKYLSGWSASALPDGSRLQCEAKGSRGVFGVVWAAAQGQVGAGRLGRGRGLAVTAEGTCTKMAVPGQSLAWLVSVLLQRWASQGGMHRWTQKGAEMAKRPASSPGKRMLEGWSSGPQDHSSVWHPGVPC